METQERFTLFHLLKYLFTLVGLLLFLLDIALDIWTVVSFYQDGAYVYMAVMIFLLLGSSVLLQVFSWLWYSDSLDKIETKVEKFADRHLLIKPFHFLQLGVHLRSVTDLLLNFQCTLVYIFKKSPHCRNKILHHHLLTHMYFQTI